MSDPVMPSAPPVVPTPVPVAPVSPVAAPVAPVAPVSAPVAPVPAPVAPVARPDPSPMAQGEQIVQFTDDAGEVRTGTVNQLVQAVKEAGSVPQITPDQMTEFETFQKVKAGDADTILSLFGSPAAPAGTAPELDPSPEAEKTRTELADLRSQVSSMSPMFQQLNAVQKRGETVGIVTQHSDKLPHLAKMVAANPAYADEVVNQMGHAETIMRQNNIDPSTLPQQKKNELHVAVLNMVEQNLSRVAQGLGAPASPVAPVAGVVDNQGQAPVGGAPQFRVVEGQIVDQQGRTYRQERNGTMTPVNVENHVPSPSSGGAQPSAVQPGQPGKISRSNLLGKMSARVQTMSPQQV